MNIKAKRQQQKDAEAAVRERWAQDKAEEQYLPNYADHIDRKMERINAVEDTKWTTTVSAIQKRKEEEARQERMNEHIEDKMAQVDAESDAEWTSVQEAEKERLMAVDAARWAGIAAMEQAKEEANSAGKDSDPFAYLKKLNPYPWLSISGEAGFDGILFTNKYIGVKNINRDIAEILFYEEQNLKVSSSVTGTQNPNGFVDINLQHLI